MKQIRRNAISIITGLIAVSVFLGGIFVNLVSNDVEKQLRISLGDNYQVVIFCACIIIAFLSGLVSWITQNPDLSEGSPSLKRIRMILIKRVKNIWINGFLTKSLHGLALLELNLEQSDDAIERPWDLVFQQSSSIRKAIPTTAKISQVFDEANQELLILGAPGSGKTTLLLQLARDLIQRAENDDTFPIPVVLNLTSWHSNQELQQWLISEMSNKYHVPKRIATHLVKNDQILLLLDGLDEVARQKRATCIQAINEFRQEHLAPLVICSRTYEYMALSTKLKLQAAILILGLTRNQIEKFLASSKKLRMLKNSIMNDESLTELASSPLFLTLMALVFKELSPEEAKRFAIGSDHRRWILEIYIKQRLLKQSPKYNFTPLSTVRWLKWLAQKMSHENLSEFLIEQIQPTWLSASPQLVVYLLISRLIIGITFASIFELIQNQYLIWGPGIILASIGPDSPSISHAIYSLKEIPSLVPEMIISYDSFEVFKNILKIGFYLGGAIMIGDIIRLGSRRDSKNSNSKDKLTINQFASLRYFFNSFAWGVVGWILFKWLTIPIVTSLRFGTTDGGVLEAARTNGYLPVLICSVLFGIIVGRRTNQLNLRDIQTTEKIAVSWSGLVLGPIIGLLLGIAIGFVEYFSPFRSISAGMTMGLFVGLIGGMMGSILLGFNTQYASNRIYPNIGIHWTLRNSAMAGFIVGTFSISLLSILVVSNSWLYKPSDFIKVFTSVNMLIFGLTYGLIASIWYGALDVIQHYILRIILLISHKTPFNYTNFLDYCSEIVLLQKTGNGYMFVHRELLELFAKLDETRLNIT